MHDVIHLLNLHVYTHMDHLQKAYIHIQPQGIVHRKYIQQKQQEHYWQPYVTSVNTATAETDTDNQEESITTVILHML
jgi:hypothetical protein